MGNKSEFLLVSHGQLPKQVLAIDMGFGEKSQGIGIAWGDSRCGVKHDSRTYTYEQGLKKAVELLQTAFKTNASLGLILEAPLSMAFTHSPNSETYGNPTPRVGISVSSTNKLERRCIEKKHRWYQNNGSSVLVASAIFLKQIMRTLSQEKRKQTPSRIYLYEAFVQKKNPQSSNRHLEEAVAIATSFLKGQKWKNETTLGYSTSWWDISPSAEGGRIHSLLEVFRIDGSKANTKVPRVLLLEHKARHFPE